MPKVSIYNHQGEEIGQQELNPAIFGIAVKPEVVQQVVTGMQANARQVLAHTKDRGDVRGGGKKPWRQKGTGRARHGSIRSPLWRGGGITFGPTKDRNFSLKINKKVKRKALLMCLSDKASNHQIILLDNFDVAEAKTKRIFSILQNLNLRKKSAKARKAKAADKTDKTVETKDRSVLLVPAGKDAKIYQAARNISRLKILPADGLNVLDILKHQYLVMPVAALSTIEKTFLKK